MVALGDDNDNNRHHHDDNNDHDDTGGVVVMVCDRGNGGDYGGGHDKVWSSRWSCQEVWARLGGWWRPASAG